MPLPNIFNKEINTRISGRINKITSESSPEWGKMNASQVLAHLNVMFELGLEKKHKTQNAFVKFMLKSLVKNKIISDKPYKKNGMTAPEMVIKHQPNFIIEKQRTLNYLRDILEKGEVFFEKREHPSFGKLSAKEWSNLFYKHINHHLTQFNL